MTAAPRAPSATDDVAPDGSPVAVYLALPAHDAVELVVDQVPPDGSVLDLGCGVGRLANPLAARSLRVVGVDEHRGMLTRCAPEVETVLGDIARIDLRRTFDAVVLASHLVNHPTRAAAFLATCRRHVASDGRVLIERFHPRLLDDLDEREGTVDPVHIRHEVHTAAGDRFAASAHYTVGGRTWSQRYEAVILDDRALDRLLAAAGLCGRRWLDEDGRWLSATRA